MKEGNTDVRYSFTSMIDSVSELFGGRLTYSDILNMDMPMMRSLVKSRLDNLSKHKERKSQFADYEKLMKEFGG